MSNKSETAVKLAPVPRSVDAIRQEYGSLCAQAGHLQYTIFNCKKDLSMLNEKMRDLNLEAAAVSNAEAAKPEAKGPVEAAADAAQGQS